MLWIAPAEKDTDSAALEERLWDAANQLRANCKLNYGSNPYEPR